MSAPVRPTVAFCAVGPDGAIDIDLVRRSQSSCHSAASNIHGLGWMALVGKGWRVVEVRLSLHTGNEGDSSADPGRDSQPRPRASAPMGTSARGGRSGPAPATPAAPKPRRAGVSAILRCSE